MKLRGKPAGRVAGKSWGWIAALALLCACPASAKPGNGKLSGMVLDPGGIPQMGAAVWVVSEAPGNRIMARLLTDQHGVFSSDSLQPGFYSVRVSLAGFLPALERHINITANLTTLLRVQMDSVFASLDSLRRKPVVPADTDDWKWVLRSSGATRAILQWQDGTPVDATSLPEKESAQAARPRGLLELTSGATLPTSPSNLGNSPGTAFSYDQSLGVAGRMLLAGQMSYEHSAAGGFASIWLPSGDLQHGPETTFVMRQASFGPGVAMFHGVRLEHSEQFSFGQSVSLRVGAEYVRVGMISSASAFRPRAELTARLGKNWSVSALAAANPAERPGEQSSLLGAVISSLDSLPVVLTRDGRPVFEGGSHAEVSAKRNFGKHASLTAAAFHDSMRHQAVYGSGPVAQADFYQDGFSNAFLYDGGGSSSWGGRIAYQQKVSDQLSFAAVYDYAAVLAPVGEIDAVAGLRDQLSSSYRHSVAGRISERIPRWNTQITASYKWLSGVALTRQDSFGEAAYSLEPNLHLTLRQPLPCPRMAGHWEATADFGNLLAQGYVNVNGQDGRLILVPILRSFRGGVSFQF